MCEDCCPTCGRPHYDHEDLVDDRTPEQIAVDYDSWTAEKMLGDSPLGMAAHPDNMEARQLEFDRRRKKSNT